MAVDRYTSIVTIPALLLLSVFLLEERRVIKKWAMPASLAFLLLASVVAVYTREDRNSLENLREAYPFLKGLNKTVFIDGRSLAAVSYIGEYSINKNLEKYPDSLGKAKNSYIAINRNMIRNLKEANKNLKFPSEIKNIPKEWKVIKEFGSSEKDKIVVYQIP